MTHDDAAMVSRAATRRAEIVGIRARRSHRGRAEAQEAVRSRANVTAGNTAGRRDQNALAVARRVAGHRARGLTGAVAGPMVRAEAIRTRNASDAAPMVGRPAGRMVRAAVIQIRHASSGAPMGGRVARRLVGLARGVMGVAVGLMVRAGAIRTRHVSDGAPMGGRVARRLVGLARGVTGVAPGRMVRAEVTRIHDVRGGTMRGGRRVRGVMGVAVGLMVRAGVVRTRDVPGGTAPARAARVTETADLVGGEMTAVLGVMRLSARRVAPAPPHPGRIATVPCARTSRNPRFHRISTCGRCHGPCVPSCAG